MSTERFLVMFTQHALLLLSLFVLTNGFNLVDLLSKLRRGNPVGGPTNVYDRSARVNTVSFGFPEGYNDAALQSQMIQPVQPSELKSNFHSLLNQFQASGGTGRGVQSTTNTRHNAPNRHQFAQVQQIPNGRQYPPVSQVPHRRQFSSGQHITSRQQVPSLTHQNNGGSWMSSTSNQNSAARQQFYPRFTQEQGTVPNQNRAQLTRTTGFTREQTPISNYGRTQVSQQNGFTRDQVPVPNHSRAQIPRTTGFTQERIPAFNTGRGQITRQNGFTQQHTTTSNSQRGVQQFSRQKGFNQTNIPKSNHGVMRQFASKMKSKVTSGSSFGRIPSNPRYTLPDIRPRQF